MLSYNEIITKFQEFAEAHYFLESFGTGEAWQVVEHNKLKNRKYPMMWVEDLPFPYSTSEVVYSFRVYFLAQVAVLKNQTATTLEQTNVVEVKSDMLQCANDLLSYWVQDHNYDELDIDKSTTAISFNQEFNDNLTGWYIDIKLSQAIKYNSCTIPMSGVTPPPSETCDPVTITLNSTGLTDVDAGGSKTMTITYANGDPVIITTTSDTASTFTGTIPDIPATAINTANLFRTGQVTSYRTGDDGDLEKGRGASWTTLDHNNGFGANTNRFTDTLGGSAYANDVIVDWAYWNQVDDTVQIWYRVVTGASNWNQSIDGALALTVGSWSNWWLPNQMELLSVAQYELDGGGNMILLNYAPFNINITGTATRLWTSTRGQTTSRYQNLAENGVILFTSSGSSQSYIATSRIPLSDLGL